MQGATSVDGIVSGLNTTDIVEKLIKLERRPIEVLEGKRDDKKEKIAAWRTLNAKTLAFNDVVKKLRRSSSFSKKEVSVSNENILSATAGSTASEGSYSVTVNKLATNQQIVSKIGYSSESATLGHYTFSLELDSGDSKEFYLAPGSDNLAGLRDAINDSDIGVKAAIIKVDESEEPYKLYLSSTKTGKANGFNLQKSGFAGLRLPFMNVGQKAEDAEIELGGQGGTTKTTIISSSNIISGSIPGISINLKEALPGTTTTINISSSSAGAGELVTEFVEKYNEVLDYIGKQFSFNSATETAGTLMGDFTLMNIQKDIRFSISDSYKLSGSVSSLRQIGVSSDNYGKLSVDDDKIMAALIDTPSDVKDFFVRGIGAKLGSLLTDISTPLVGSITTRAKLLENQVDNINKTIKRAEGFLTRKKASLFAQFTRMEGIMGQLQSQGNFLSQQINGLVGFKSNK